MFDEDWPRFVVKMVTGGRQDQGAELVACAAHVVQPDHRLAGFALGKVIAEQRLGAVGLFHEMLGVEPPGQQGARGVRGFRAATVALHRFR
jgi:hypothetical protein